MRELDEQEWAREQTCGPLDGDEQVNVAKLFASVRQLPLHKDRWKNWDSFLAIHHALRLVERYDLVLDAGACRDPGSPSAFLPSLKKLHFSNLTGCNLDEKETVVEDGITYEHNDITWTNYQKGQFAYVACLSTIEHGVDWRKYFAEMARIIRPGGYLFTSFDYWQSAIDTKGLMAFGAPVHIFTANEVMQMALYAKSVGLDLMKAPRLECKGRPVHWLGMNYTFMNLLMKRAPAGD